MPRLRFPTLCRLGLLAATLTGRAAPAIAEEDYNQWKQALGTNLATPAAHLTSLPGFQVTLVRSAQTNEGSWVAMTFDPKGRVIIAREDCGLLRLTLDAKHTAVRRVEIINTNLLECRGLLFAFDALYANANNSKALVRLRDTKGDDQFDEVQVLRSTPGGVGHGRNQLALGPDGFIYSIHGDDVGMPTNGVSATSPLRHYAEDRLLPCAWDKQLFNPSASMPYGHVIRTDRNGEQWELWAGGLRNPFGLAFNAAGDLFTFDADMEWDVGLSWYHPTRVLQIIPGGDYGWRRGTGVLPVWSPDTLPSVADIGLGSPTAIQFGTRSNWPERWRQALFIEDWSYGRILAVHLTRSGASYTGRSEEFLKGRPLNVTGLAFGPDGAMYFTTGGRRTQSGLYRVAWTGAAVPAQTDAPKAEPIDANRRTENIWSRLDDADHWIRFRARAELETVPVDQWAERALAESRPTAALTSLLALSRSGDRGLKPQIIARLNQLTNSRLSSEQQLRAIRALSVCFIRLGAPDEVTSSVERDLWEPMYPSTSDSRVNQSLCELLVYLGSSRVVARTMPLFNGAASQEEKFHYLFTLRLVTNGWSLDTRRIYFDWLRRARTEFNGANLLPTALNYIRADAESTLSAEERRGLKEALLALDQRAAVPTVSLTRPFVKEWKMLDWEPSLLFADGPRDAMRGKKLFAETGCAQCHRLGGEGGITGPDLTAVSSRFDRRALIESIIEPSKVVAEVYRAMTITLNSGAMLEGRIVSEDATSLVFAPNPLDPDQHQRVAKSDIAQRRVSELSPMPTGLLNTLTHLEILDLLAWTEAGGDLNHPLLRPTK